MMRDCSWHRRGLLVALLSLGLGTACAGSTDGPADDGLAGGDAQVGDSSEPPAEVAMCMRGAKEQAQGPCDAHLDPASGMAIPLGPYGAQVELDIREVGDQTFETNSDTPASTAICHSFGEALGADRQVRELIAVDGLDLSAFSVYRPARLGEGERYPVLAWGNGICTATEAYGTLLRYIASHGFIVVAPNSRFVNSGEDLIRGIDLVLAMDTDPAGPLYGHVDASRIGAMGHTEGAGGANNAARIDDRIQGAILWHGVFPPTRLDLPYLAVSGDFNQRAVTVESMSSTLRAPGGYLYLRDSAGTGPLRGMLSVVLEPTRVMDVAVQFWRMVLLDDDEATGWFAGDDCELCESDAMGAIGRYEFGSVGF